MKFLNFMTFQVFHDLYEPWTIEFTDTNKKYKMYGMS